MITCGHYSQTQEAPLDFASLMPLYLGSERSLTESNITIYIVMKNIKITDSIENIMILKLYIDCNFNRLIKM